MKNEKCMNCRSNNLERFIDLGKQPNGNYFVEASDFEEEPFFPFAMSVCKDCWQVQIDEYPSVDFMFVNHPYITGVNMPVVTHFEEMVDRTLEKFNVDKNGLVLDIGANDGTLLKCFEKRGLRTLGIDPGKRTGKLARENGITVCETFWNEATAKSIRDLNLKPDIISATAVFYHIDDIHSFVKGLKEVMHDRSIFMTQCVYMKDVLEKLQFDHFYHEHTMMHSIRPLERLFKEYGLKMIDADLYPVHGGSFVLYVAKEEAPYPIKSSIKELMDAETQAGMNQIETYHEFTKKVEANKTDLVKLLNDLKDAGKSVFALGAPLKGSTLLNYYGIGPSLVEKATEVNRFKIGKYTPGTHIPIVYEDTVEEQPDYYLVLSWNFIDFFIEKYRTFLDKGGKLIVPHPNVRIIDRDSID